MLLIYELSAAKQSRLATTILQLMFYKCD